MYTKSMVKYFLRKDPIVGEADEERIKPQLDLLPDEPLTESQLPSLFKDEDLKNVFWQLWEADPEMKRLAIQST